MSKKHLYALVLIGLTVLVLLFNTKDVHNLNLFFTSIRAMAALVFLSFTAVGIVIGTLLR